MVDIGSREGNERTLLRRGTTCCARGDGRTLLALYDQRGSAAVNRTVGYTRFSGVGLGADIGAYEVQQNDIVFDTDFALRTAVSR